MDRIDLPKQVEYILTRLNNSGYEAYVVGGCVRDSIMGITPNDWDICTSAKPEEVMELFSDLRVIPTGMKHGTVTVVVDCVEFEITTYRIDGEYADNRHPSSVEFVTDLQQDLMRRDFTINALAYNHKDGIVDYFGGIDDLRNKTIRCVGNPNHRFQEDALRMLRAIRFAVRFGFNISCKTRQALLSNANLLSKISAERINSEVIKTLECDLHNSEGLLNDMIKLLSVVESEFDNVDSTAISKRLVDSTHLLELRLALLFNFDESVLTEKLKALKFSNDHVNLIVTINKHGKAILKGITAITYCDDSICNKRYNKAYNIKRQFQKDYSIRRLLYEVGFDYAIMSIEYALSFLNPESCAWNELLSIEGRLGLYAEENKVFKLSDLAINGNDLKEIGYKGKQIGKVLNVLLDMVLRDVIKNDHNVLLNVAASIKELLL